MSILILWILVGCVYGLVMGLLGYGARSKQFWIGYSVYLVAYLAWGLHT